MRKAKGYWTEEKPDVWVLRNRSDRNVIATLVRKQFSSNWIGVADFDGIASCFAIQIENRQLKNLKHAAERICNVFVPEKNK